MIGSGLVIRLAALFVCLAAAYFYKQAPMRADITVNPTDSNDTGEQWWCVAIFNPFVI